MLVRERQTPEGLLVSVCDPECLGETYEGRGDAGDEVRLAVTEEFYGGDDAEECGPEAVVDSLRRAVTANIVGDRAVDVAVDAGLVEEDRVLELDGTRHAQLLWLR